MQIVLDFFDLIGSEAMYFEAKFYLVAFNLTLGRGRKNSVWTSPAIKIIITPRGSPVNYYGSHCLW